MRNKQTFMPSDAPAHNTTSCQSHGIPPSLLCMYSAACFLIYSMPGESVYDPVRERKNLSYSKVQTGLNFHHTVHLKSTKYDLQSLSYSPTLPPRQPARISFARCLTSAGNFGSSRSGVYEIHAKTYNRCKTKEFSINKLDTDLMYTKC
jgi:hypothetical protein